MAYQQNDLILALEHICDAVSDLATLKAQIEANRVLIEGAYDVDVTEEEETAILKAFTGEVSRLDIDLACYPLGYPTTILFDTDGNLV